MVFKKRFPTFGLYYLLNHMTGHEHITVGAGVNYFINNLINKGLFSLNKVTNLGMGINTQVAGIIWVLLICCQPVSADNRSDTINILHCDIALSVRNFASKSISGEAILRCTPKVNGVQRIRLDLLKLNITAVTINGVAQTHTRNDSEVFVTFGQTQNIADTFDLRIAYNGQPMTDPQWGGFYFSGDYAFNMGVGFVLDPHPFGRCWFPCFDNFSERATYDLHITTDSAYKAVCGGLLKSVTTNPDNSKTWNWSMGTSVPSYLVSVTVSKYEFVQSTYSGANGNIPIMIAAKAADTTNVKTAFVHLPDALSIFENHYGPYRFERVGYSLVPFNSGAMEHACNISYPVYAVGSSAYETLYAHELSHHWWGNLATCRTAGDMWLNEGWASYSEAVFLEGLYGKTAYESKVKSNHIDVLRYAHIKDGDFRAVAGVPHQYTYGQHVYHKGADVIHTLRSYMGDSAFFAAAHSYLNLYQFRDVSTDDLKDHFKTFTSADLDSYFKDWINNKGYCDFRITAFKAQAAGTSFDVKVTIAQELRAANGYYTNVPLTITFYDQQWQAVTKSFLISGATLELNYALPFSPVFTVIDEHEKISFARTKNTIVLDTVGLTSLTDGLLDITVNTITDSALMHVEHHWTRPDQAMCHIPGLYLSNYRYWKVDGIWPSNFKASAYFNYDGTTVGYLDHTFIKKTEDSLFLVWRPDAMSAWQKLSDLTVTRQGGGPLDKKGKFFLKDLKKGEYALAMSDMNLSGTMQTKIPAKKLQIYPNPAKDLLNVKMDFAHNGCSFTIYDMNGRNMLDIPVSSMLNQITVDVSSLSKGYYLMVLNDPHVKLRKKFLIE